MEAIVTKAKEQAKIESSRIIELVKNKKGRDKLIYLIRQLSWYESIKSSPVPAFNYEFKYKLVVASDNDELNRLELNEIVQSFNTCKSYLNNYQKAMGESIDKPANIQDRILFPEEIIQVAIRTGAKFVSDIKLDDLAQEIIAACTVALELNSELNEVLDELIVTDEDFQRLAGEYGTRLVWLGDGKALAYLTDCLQSNDWLDYPNGRNSLSHPKVAAILLAHFQVMNNHSTKKTPISLPTMTTYVKDAKVNVVPEIEIKQRTIK